MDKKSDMNAANEAAPPSVETSNDEVVEDSGQSQFLSEPLDGNEKYDALLIEKQELYDRYLRVVAEKDNIQKRAIKEVSDARINGRSRSLRDILPIIDNLQRAVEHEQDQSISVIEGVRLVLRQFNQMLERNGSSVIDAEGKTFDPLLHEAIAHVPSDDVPVGVIISVTQVGYQLEKKLLRPSMVVVSSGPVQNSTNENSQESSDTSSQESNINADLVESVDVD